MNQLSLNNLLANLPGMAYRCRNEADWRMEFVSEGSLALTGYSPADLAENARVAFVDLIHPDDRERVWQEVQAALAADQPFHVTYRLVTASGDQRWVMEQGRGTRVADGRFTTLEGILTDVTDRVNSRRDLERRVAERTRELATLLKVSASIASTLHLGPLLRLILEQFRDVVDYVASAIFLLDGESELRLLDYIGPLARTDLDWVWNLEEVGHSAEVVRSARPVIIPDIHADTPMAVAFRAKSMHDIGTVPDYLASWMGVPLIVRDRVIGVLAVDGAIPDAYTAYHAELAAAFATQAAIAIENARLYEQAQGMAALEERQRLARELHDSVSQALFGIGLGARTARTLLDQDPARAAEPLDYVLTLAEAGLTEMRALIFELRPEALEQEGLVAALEKQAATLRSRHGIAVEANLTKNSTVPLPIEEAVYRIAQEALHNTVKHAHASRIELRLSSNPECITLVVADDGDGFDPDATYAGHLGLKTMRERAERFGGALRIESAPGAGSRLQVEIPLSRA